MTALSFSLFSNHVNLSPVSQHASLLHIPLPLCLLLSLTGIFVNSSFAWLTFTHSLRLSSQILFSVKTQNSLGKVGHSHLCDDTYHLSCHRTFLLYCTMGLCYVSVSCELFKTRKELMIFLCCFRGGLLYSWLSKNACWRKQIIRSSLRSGTTCFFFSAVYPTSSTTQRKCSIDIWIKKELDCQF